MVSVSYYPIFKKIVATTAFRGISAIATVLMTLAITRHFSSDKAGIILLGIATITVLGQILTFGCHNSATKTTGTNFHAHKWGIINQDIAAFINIILIIGILLIIPTSIVFEYFPELHLPPLPLLLGGICVALIQLFAGALIGIQRQNIATILLNGLTPLSMTALVLISVHYYKLSQSDSLVWMYTLCLLFTLTVALISWYSKNEASYSTTLSLTKDTQTLAKSLYPVVLAQLSTQYASQFAIVFFLADSDFAYFSSALRTSLLISFILMAANLVVAGKFAEYYARKEIEKVDLLALQSSRILVGIAFPLGAIVLLFSENVMSIFGTEYSAGTMALQIMVVGQLINVATGSTNYLLSMCGQEKSLRKVLFITFGIATTSAAILTPLFGIEGAAASTALGVASQNLLATHFVKRHLGFNSLNLLRKPVKPC